MAGISLPSSAPVVAIAIRTDLFIPWTYIHLQPIYSSDVILYTLLAIVLAEGYVCDVHDIGQ